MLEDSGRPGVHAQAFLAELEKLYQRPQSIPGIWVSLKASFLLHPFLQLYFSTGGAPGSCTLGSVGPAVNNRAPGQSSGQGLAGRGTFIREERPRDVIKI